MSTNCKSESARANGAKSKGPKTPEGKAASSQNAITHGLTANFTVLSNESEDDFQRLLDSYVDRYEPSDPVEMELVQTMAITRWRLRRLGNLESSLLNNEVVKSAAEVDMEWATIPDDERLALAFRKLAEESKALALLMRYEASLNRAYERAVKQLELLQNSLRRNEPNQPLTPGPKPTSLPRRISPDPEADILNRDFAEPEEPPPAESPEWEKAA
jgi:hypothetical protein